MDSLLDTARAAADAAALVHLEWAGRIGVDSAEAKGRSDFVSRVDHEAQRAALGIISARHPEHAILAEEDDVESQREALRSSDGLPIWIVDPLDGTTNFLHGFPMYASSVAVAIDGEVVAGAVSCATTGERWWGLKGGGAWKQGGEPQPTAVSAPPPARRISVSTTSDLGGALVATGFPFKQIDALDRYLDQFARVLRATSGIRRGGAAALDLCYLAEGRVDAFWEGFLNPWDFAAGVLFVQEAGGVIEALAGGPLGIEEGGVIGANSRSMMTELRSRVTPTDK